MISRMFITGIIPVTALIYLNWGIHKAVRTRKKHQRQSTSNNNNAGNNDLELSPLPPRAATTPPATATTRYAHYFNGLRIVGFGKPAPGINKINRIYTVVIFIPSTI